MLEVSTDEMLKIGRDLRMHELKDQIVNLCTEINELRDKYFRKLRKKSDRLNQLREEFFSIPNADDEEYVDDIYDSMYDAGYSSNEGEIKDFALWESSFC